eukprot:3937177-Rhodomonas_salina.1
MCRTFTHLHISKKNISARAHLCKHIRRVACVVRGEASSSLPTASRELTLLKAVSRGWRQAQEKLRIAAEEEEAALMKQHSTHLTAVRNKCKVLQSTQQQVVTELKTTMQSFLSSMDQCGTCLKAPPQVDQKRLRSEGENDDGFNEDFEGVRMCSLCLPFCADCCNAAYKKVFGSEESTFFLPS